MPLTADLPAAADSPRSSPSQHPVLRAGALWEITLPTEGGVREASADGGGEGPTDDDVTESSDGEDALVLEQYAFYHEGGGTPLFAAVEAGDWAHALSLVRETPRQVRTWVKSTGTVGTTFHWSVWQRLPLHEACRRQAPAWLVCSLLRAFPESAARMTQFGALPLHLAVECGAGPEVVNLLIAANFAGVAARDQSGRTPLEILGETELLDLDDQRVVLESLTRSTDTYNAVFTAHADEIEQIVQEHAEGLAALRSQHEADLRIEHEQHWKLEDEIVGLSRIVSELTSLSSEQSSVIEAFAEVENSWAEKNLSLEAKLKQSEEELKNSRRLVNALRELITLKDDELSAMNECNAHLTKDLQTSHMIQTKAHPSLMETRTHLRKAMSSFLQVCNQLEYHSSDLQEVLSFRSIERLSSREAEWDSEEKKSECPDLPARDEGATMETPLLDESPNSPKLLREAPYDQTAAFLTSSRNSPDEDDEVMCFIWSLEKDDDVSPDVLGDHVAEEMATGTTEAQERA